MPVSEPMETGADMGGEAPMDFGGDAGEQDPSQAPAPEGSNDMPFDKEPFDAGVEADEESDPKKFIEQLTGKLGQSLRKYTEEQGQPDFELEKFAINSVLSATHTSEMDSEDQKDIIKKVKEAGKNDDVSQETNPPADENPPMEEPAQEPVEEPTGEEGLEEYHIYESMDNLFVNPKKNNMFQEGSNDILDEADRCTRIAKRKYDVWPSAYASGAVVKCRKGKIWKGIKEEDLKEIADYKNMTDEQLDEKWSEKYKKSIDCNNPKGFSQKAHCQGKKKHDESIEEAAKKTNFSKEKKSGLHGWFSRRGGEGSKGWVDCNTCVDGKCKPCGRKEGEKRSEYPSCRPTPGSCKSKGRGKSWGKKSANESEYNIYENLDNMEESNNYMFWQNLKSINDDATEILGMNPHEVDELLSNGHDWAVEHVVTTKDDVEEVYHFLEYNMEAKPEMMSENREMQNYMFFASLKTIVHASSELLEMDEDMVDSVLSNGHGWAIDHIATSADDMEEVYHFLANTLNAYDGDTEGGYEDEYGNVENINMNEAEYKGKTVKLGKPTKGDVKKFKVYVKNKKGRVVKVNFGDPNMEIKRDNPKRRKSFRARHKCAQAKDRTTPKYWSCKMWSRRPVSKIVSEKTNEVNENLFKSNKNSTFDKLFLKKKLNETFNQNDKMSEPITKPITKPATTPSETPSRKNKPFLPQPNIPVPPKAIKEGKSNFEIYHKTLASCLDEIKDYAIARGFDPIEFGTFDVEHVNYGTTKRITLPLMVNGEPNRKRLFAQIYRMDSGNYELNMYVS
jgi:hypothetical protein